MYDQYRNGPLEVDNCSICLGTMVKTLYTECNHQYHAGCIMK